MGHTRVVYTDSTTAECSTVLKMFNFEEDQKSGFFRLPDEDSLKVYVVWGRTVYYPDFHIKLDFVPRVQLHFKTKDKADSLDFFTRETIVALKNLDPNSRIRVFNAESGIELTT